MAHPHASRRYALGIIGLIVGMLTASGGQPLGADLAQAPGLTLSRSSGPPTTRISVSGTGFTAGETIALSFDATELTTVDADATGSFSGARLRVPASARPRTHTVSALGLTSALRGEASFLVRTDWPQYRGSPARLGYNRYENVLSVSNVDRLQTAWTFDTGAEIYASPTVVDGILYSGTGFTGAGTGQVYALDAMSGELVWEATLGTESPAVRGGIAYGVHDDDVSALDAATGEPVWSYAGGEEGFRNGVALVRGIVYAVAPRGEVVALDASDGTLLWSRSIREDLWATPSVAGGSVVVGTVTHRVYSLDASTGAVRWRIRVPDYIISSAAVSRGVIYVGMGEGLYALDARTGERIWRTERAAGTTPAIADGLVYAGTGYGDVDAYDVSTGDLVWRFHAGGGDVESSPTVANGVVYVGSNADTVFALDAGTGRELWSFRTGLGIKSSPTVVNGMLYVGSKDEKIYAFGLD